MTAAKLKLRVSPGFRGWGAAGRLHVPPGTCAIVSGHTSREKIVVLNGLEQAHTERLLAAAGRED